MANPVQALLEERKFPEVYAYINSHNVRYQSLAELSYDDDCIMSAQLLSMKKPKGDGARKLTFARGKSVAQYNRLFLYRELREGELFYVLCEHQEESNKMMWMFGELSIGAYNYFYEPRVVGEIHGLKVVACETYPIPLISHLVDMKRIPIVPALEVNREVAAFNFEIGKIEINQLQIEKACASRHCDSAHWGKVACPGLGGARSNGVCLRGSVSGNFYGIGSNVMITFRSEKLAKFFIDESFLRIDRLDAIGVRVAVKQVLRFYEEQGVPWMLSGWFKRNYLQDGTPMEGVVYHLSAMSPLPPSSRAPLYGRSNDEADSGASVDDSATAEAAQE